MKISRKHFPNLTPKTIQLEWQKRGFSFGIMRDPPGQCWENFVHTVDEVVTPLSQAIEIEEEGERAALHPGDEWFIPKGARHSVRNKSSQEAHWCYGYRNL